MRDVPVFPRPFAGRIWLLCLAATALACCGLPSANGATDDPAPTISADMFNNFAAGEDGKLLTVDVLNKSALGGGSWGLASKAKEFQSLRTVVGRDMTFKTPFRVGAKVVTSSGPMWVRYDHSTTRPVESASFYTPGPYGGGVYKKLLVRGFWKFANKNGRGGGVNFDPVVSYGNPFGALQEQTYPGGGAKIIAHGPGGNGRYIEFTLGKIYFVEMLRDDEAAIFRVRFYDPDDGYRLTGESTAKLGSTAGSGWWIMFQANYLDLGGVTGYTEFAGVSVTWNNVNSDLPP